MTGIPSDPGSFCSPGERELPESGGGGGELMLMLLADARLPTGAHTQSAGLEPAMNAGVRIDEIPDLIAARAATVTAVEAGTAVVARHLTLTTAGAALTGALLETDIAWQSRTVSAALREASVLAARGHLRLIRNLWPDRPEIAAVAAVPTPCRPVVLGVIAAVTGLAADQLVRLIGNDDAATIAAAVLKVQPVDPVRTTRWVLDAHPHIEELAARLATLTRISAIPATAAPLIEEWAEIHATTTQRLFRA